MRAWRSPGMASQDQVSPRTPREIPWRPGKPRRALESSGQLSLRNPRNASGRQGMPGRSLGHWKPLETWPRTISSAGGKNLAALKIVQRPGLAWALQGFLDFLGGPELFSDVLGIPRLPWARLGFSGFSQAS